MNIHKIENARKQIKDKYPEFTFPKKSYLVLYSARSGSNLLSRYLEEAGIGKPREAFNPNINNRQNLNWGIDYEDPVEYIQTAIDKLTLNGVMGMKLAIPQFELFLNTVKSILSDSELDEPEIIETVFPNVKYIHIQRRDKVKQAISFSKAKQNGIWFEKAGEDTSYKNYVIPAVYDRQHIEFSFDQLLMEDVSWDHFLSKNKLPFILVWYEELAKNPQKTISEVCKFLDVSGKEIIKVPLRKQSNKKSKDWEIRFRKETSWLENKKIRQALINGDLLSLAITRSLMTSSQRENNRYWQMPSTKFRWFRKWFIRGHRKIKTILEKPESQ